MYEIYQIEMNDTLDSIADKVGSTIQELSKINKTIDITPGAYIIVPASDNNMFGMYTVKKGDNPYEIAAKYGISINNLMMMNGLEKSDYIYPGQQLIVPNKNMFVYITKEGDTLDKVLSNLNGDINRFLEQNNKIYLVPEQLIAYRK